MKTRMIASFLVIALVAAVIGGASMAYFTAKQDAPENVFVAGTVMIEAGKEFVWDAEKMENVNPGDCFSKCIQVYNTGTKAIELRLAGMEFDFGINWEWICANWDALCFSKIMIDEQPKYEDCQALQEAILTAIEGGRVTNPANANGDGDGIFDEDGNFIVPVMAAPCPGSGWIMKYLADGSVVFFYAGGPLARGAVTELCVVVVFDGPWMGNLWQGATFTMGGGMFQAVQASNNAPEEVWGEAVWDNYQTVAAAEGDAARLKAGTDVLYAEYFYGAEDDFLFADCCLATARVTTQEELERALANEEIQRIKLYGTFDGFVLNRGVIIQGGTINAVTVPGEPRPTGIFLNTEEDVTITGVTFDGSGAPAGSMPQGVLSIWDFSTRVDVNNCKFLNLHMGVYFNPGAYGTIYANTFSNIDHCAIGIDSDAGVEIFDNYIEDAFIGIQIFRANVVYYNNTFVNVTTPVDDQS